jgi:hypothetical protein
MKTSVTLNTLQWRTRKTKPLRLKRTTSIWVDLCDLFVTNWIGKGMNNIHFVNFVLIYLFSDHLTATLNVSNYIASNESKLSDSNLKYHSGICLEVIMKTSVTIHGLGTDT